jgi:heterodisulfide reductase subunit D
MVKILGAIPGIELVDLDQPRVGYMCNSLAPVAAYKRELHARELEAARMAGVDALVGIYQACHRELCAHEATMPFRIVNFLELVGEAIRVEHRDLFKQWKMMQDVDRVLAEIGDQVEREGLDPEAVREVMWPACCASNRCRSPHRASSRSDAGRALPRPLSGVAWDAPPRARVAA